MKHFSKKILQTLLGFDNYLFCFSIFKIKTFKWDKKERDFFHFLNMMQEGSTVLDVGSNIGITTIHLSKHVKASGKVHSFEPLPPNYKTLDKVIDYYKCTNVEVHKIAVGDDEAEVEMVLPEVSNVKMQGLGHVVHKDLTEFNEGSIYKAPLRRLDNLEYLAGKKIDGIKLDVENFEYFALRGGSELLKRDRPVVYAELWENENRTRCFELMTELGYAIKILIGDELIDFEEAKHKTQNFFFV